MAPRIAQFASRKAAGAALPVRDPGAPGRRSGGSAKQGDAPAQPIAGQRIAGERSLIAALRAAALRNAAAHAVTGGPTMLRVGIGDDCAVLRPVAHDEIVVTTDLFLEKVHFRRDWHQPEVAGHRCLARGLSDIAAMGATPAAAFLSLALPSELAGNWVRRFLAGLLRLASLHHLPLAGGDTAQAAGIFPLPTSSRARRTQSREAPPKSASGAALFMADIVLLGTVRRGKALLRSSALAGDAIYVTGSLGGAAAELALLQQAPGTYARLLKSRPGHPHLFPQPRLLVGHALLGRATSAIDLSDGLSTDLAHLCEESGVAAEIEAPLLPIHPLASGAVDGGIALALHGGEDYELLFTVPARRHMPPEIAGTPIHRVGRIVPAGRGRSRITLLGLDGSRSRLRNLGWEHFR